MPTVDQYLATLDHPHREGILALRQTILGVDDRIREAVKWNAPSFLLQDHFATFRLRPGAVFQLILHTGAKARPDPTPIQIADPGRLIQWASPDRGVIAFASSQDALDKRVDVARFVQEWITQL
ncbi:MAG: DUF1801 domain-containing protein [Alphaproteobacteria bacterium]|nr:DUF1801 domain-containing protein [Alphaproteobacteria bacterium]